MTARDLVPVSTPLWSPTLSLHGGVLRSREQGSSLLKVMSTSESTQPESSLQFAGQSTPPTSLACSGDLLRQAVLLIPFPPSFLKTHKEHKITLKMNLTQNYSNHLVYFCGLQSTSISLWGINLLSSPVGCITFPLQLRKLRLNLGREDILPGVIRPHWAVQLEQESPGLPMPACSVRTLDTGGDALPRMQHSALLPQPQQLGERSPRRSKKEGESSITYRSLCKARCSHSGRSRSSERSTPC